MAYAAEVSRLHSEPPVDTRALQANLGAITDSLRDSFRKLDNMLDRIRGPVPQCDSAGASAPVSDCIMLQAGEIERLANYINNLTSEIGQFI